jgi:DNA-binding CsgD family transcriptional regulator
MKTSAEVAVRHVEVGIQPASGLEAPLVSETASPPAPERTRPFRERLRRFEPVASAVIFATITVCIAADFIGDVARGESALHLAGMAIGTVLSVIGLVLMLRMLAAARARSRELQVALDHTREDSIRWREQTAQILKGIGELIDRQFAEWGLTPSEREIALLLLKGLSLKSIAEARNASEPTVRQQAQSVYRKAELAGRAELSAFFLEDLLLPQTPGAAQKPPPIAPIRSGRG